jgi:D-alanyl-D-alanine carboxypeptidase
VLGGTSNAARDERMRQLIEDHISEASTQQTAPIIVEANGEQGAREGSAHVGIVAPAARNAAAPNGERLDVTLALAKAEPVHIPKSRHTAKRPAKASKQALGDKASPNHAQRSTANTANNLSALKVRRDGPTSATRQTRNVEPSVAPPASMSRHY